jgi:hypothetical protein
MSQIPDQRDEFFDRLMSMSRQALADQEYEVAYHTLAAAMHHCLTLQQPLPLLREVLSEAAHEQKTLGTLAPEHAISSFTAHRHGHQSVYDALQNQLITRIRLLETKPLFGKGESIAQWLSESSSS